MCLPSLGEEIGGPLGMIVDPGYATASLAGEVWSPAGDILNPSHWPDLMNPKPKEAPTSSKAPVKTGIEIAAEAKNQVLADQAAQRKRQASLLAGYKDLGTDKSGYSTNPIYKPQPIGTQKLDSVLAQGKQLLGT